MAEAPPPKKIKLTTTLPCQFANIVVIVSNEVEATTPSSDEETSPGQRYTGLSTEVTLAIAATIFLIAILVGIGFACWRWERYNSRCCILGLPDARIGKLYPPAYWSVLPWITKPSYVCSTYLLSWKRSSRSDEHSCCGILRGHFIPWKASTKNLLLLQSTPILFILSGTKNPAAHSNFENQTCQTKLVSL